MKDRIEIVSELNKHGKEILKFYVHCDLGYLWLFNKPKTKGVYDYFANGKSVSELYKHKYRNNETLNKIVDRLPAHVKYAKQMAMEENEYVLSIVRPNNEKEREFMELTA